MHVYNLLIHKMNIVVHCLLNVVWKLSGRVNVEKLHETQVMSEGKLLENIKQSQDKFICVKCIDAYPFPDLCLSTPQKQGAGHA